MLQLLKPKLPRACALQWEATAMSPHNARKRNPYSPRLEKAPKATKTPHRQRKRNGESLWSIRKGVLSLSAQRDDAAEGRLRATSLGAIGIGQTKADESLNGPYSIKEKGRGVEMVCARCWARHYRDGSHSPSHWVLKNNLTELLGIQMSSLSWLLDLGRQTHLVVESGTFFLSKWMLSFICHQPCWAIKEKMRVFGLGEGIKRNFTQHPFKMARQILFELLQSRKEISV